MAKQQKGFTRMEVLLVVAVIIIALAIAALIHDPTKGLREQRDARRSFDVAQIATAARAAQVSNGGRHIPTIASLLTNTVYAIGTQTENCSKLCGGVTTQISCANLSPLVDGHFLSDVPFDPLTGSNDMTDYVVVRNITGTVTVTACSPELAKIIQETR